MDVIFRYIKPYMGVLVGGLSVKFIGSLLDLLLPMILAYLIDQVAPRGMVSHILLWGGVMALCAVLAFIMNVAANRMAAAVARDSIREIRHDLFAKTLRLSCVQIDGLTIPSLISRLSSDTYNLHRMISGMQRVGIRGPLILLGGICITLTMEPALTLVLLATLPFTFGIVTLVSMKGIPLYTKLQTSVDAMVRVVRENAQGIRIVKALSKGEFERGRFEEVNGAVTQGEWKANIVMSITNPVMFLILNIGLVGILLLGAHRVNEGFAKPGAILAFLTYFTIILHATLSITRMFVMYSRGSASGRRVAEVLNLPETEFVLEDTSRVEVSSGGTAGAGAAVGGTEVAVTPRISFEDVYFSYYPVEGKPPLLSGISFSINPGETLGILGETGSGKSTILQLLLRFYEVGGGVIRVDGRDIRTIPLDEYYRRFGAAFQKDALFADTVRENIAFGREISDEDIALALRCAQGEGFVNELDGGWDHVLSFRGTNLSGGQRQRLMIARALAGKPDILILDDSSSALDYSTDARLRRDLEAHYQGTTRIIVAQRLSSLAKADRILALEQGRIIASGSPAELLETSPLYREWYTAQMGEAVCQG